VDNKFANLLNSLLDDLQYQHPISSGVHNPDVLLEFSTGL